MNRLVPLGVFVALATGACAAHAEIFDIAADGTVAVRVGYGDLTEVGDHPSVGPGPAEDGVPELPAAALTTIDPPDVPVAFQAPLAIAAHNAKVSPALLAALVWQESRWHPSAISPKGARGLTQLMPGTARALAVDPADAASNLAGGARYLRAMLDMFDGNVERALAAYNAGPGRVLRSSSLPGIAETRAYVASIIDRVGLSKSPSRGGVAP